MLIKDTLEYQAITRFYGERTTKRSGVRLMNHIDEGLAIMAILGASNDARRAFCLHPLFQADAEMTTVGVAFLDDQYKNPVPIFLAMEYRYRANSFLADKVEVRTDLGGPVYVFNGLATPGPLPELRDMLIADKVQNRKDFEQFHKGTHVHSDQLDHYFRYWLNVLGISEKRYEQLREHIK